MVDEKTLGTKVAIDEGDDVTDDDGDVVADTLGPEVTSDVGDTDGVVDDVALGYALGS